MRVTGRNFRGVCVIAVASVIATGGVALAQVRTVNVEVAAKHKTTDKTWTDRETRILDPQALPPLQKIPLDKYGGRTDRPHKGSGFFQVVHIDGKWTFLDPLGNEFFSAGQDAVGADDSPGGSAALAQKFGDHAGWAKATAALLKENGFNSLGCWSDYKAFESAGVPMPYTTQLSLMSGYGHQRGGTHQATGHAGYLNDCIFIFDPGFEEYCKTSATKQLADLKNDPWLLGHFSDNELPLRLEMLDKFLKLPAQEPGRIAADKWWAERRGNTDRQITDEDREAFANLVAERYYRIVSNAIHQADPNHLYFGSRWINSSSRIDGILRGAAPYVDVLSINYYGAWSPDPQWLNKWANVAKRPFMITEWYAKGMDSGMGNTTGAGWVVKTQQDRGRFYQNFALDLLADPDCVGWHWFKYMDNDPDVKSDPSNLDSNKGILNDRYEPYAPLLTAMRELNERLYALRDNPPPFIAPPPSNDTEPKKTNKH